ncbi:MAG: hypothetical protein KJZ80_10005 [Hyphomicrobiaceae bacterium]|nr:hypothetical protein [Hyphomicrobiaceae bacterium]
MTEHVVRLARRIAALGLLLLLAATLHLALVKPYLAHLAGLKEELAQQRTLLGRLAAIAELEPRLPELERRAIAASKSGAFISGASEALMTAGLQSRVAALASEAGVRVRTTRALPARERDGIRLLGVQVQLAASIGQVQRIVHAIETGQPMLFIEGLHIAAPSGRPASGEDAGLLETRIDVFAAAAADRS